VRSNRLSINQPESAELKNNVCYLLQVPKPTFQHPIMFWRWAVSIVLFASAFSFIVNAAPDSATDALTQIPPCGVRSLPKTYMHSIDQDSLNVSQRTCPSSVAVSLMSSVSATPRIQLQYCSRACWRNALLIKHLVRLLFITALVRNVTNSPADILHAQATLCNRPHDSYANPMRITAYVTGIIPVIAVAMRFASRWLGGNPFWWDDWVHLASAVSQHTASCSCPY
jgi:hypothetical protein